jgi:hypothetical protein
MMNRKLLFVVFTNDSCKRNHAFMHALALTRNGHRVRIILEGEGTRCLAERSGRFGELFAEALAKGVLAGACRTASAGCSTTDASRDMSSLAREQGILLLGEMDGHAGIVDYVADGYEMVVY